MSFRRAYATLTKKWPRVFDLSKAAFRRLEKPDPLRKILSDFDKGNESIFFLQIGSNDGISNDPLREFIVRGNKWKGCLVEPIPHTFEKLIRNYQYKKRDSLKFRNAAISDTCSQVHIYRVKTEFHNEMPGQPDQVASFDSEHVIKHFPSEFRSKEKIEAVAVDALTPAALIQESGLSRIDLLHLDVEGHEKKIFDAYPFEEKCPKIIIYERIHLSDSDRKSVEKRLRDLNFKLQDIGIDTVAVQIAS